MKFLSTLFTTLILATAALAAPLPVEAREPEAVPGFASYGSYPPPAGGYGNYGKYGGYGSYKREVEAKREPDAKAADFGSYGTYATPKGGYGSYGTYAPPAGGYGKYGSYGTYKRVAEFVKRWWN